MQPLEGGSERNGYKRSNESTSITGPFNKELVDALPKSLKYVCHNGAGYDNIEVPACTERSIEISSTPIAVNDATADSIYVHPHQPANPAKMMQLQFSSCSAPFVE